jgi:hypothetical protein
MSANARNRLDEQTRTLPAERTNRNAPAKAGAFCFSGWRRHFSAHLGPGVIGLESVVNPLVSHNSPSWSSNINDFMV